MDAKRKLQEIAAKDLGGSPDQYDVANGRVFRKGNPGGGMTFAKAAERAIALGGKYDGHEMPSSIHDMTKAAVTGLAGQGLIGVAKDEIPRDGTTYAATYTVDGQFGAGANATKGREALKKMVDALKEQETAAKAKGEARPPMYHMEANSWIEFIDKDHARYHSYYLTVVAGSGANTPPRIAAAGCSVNHLERVNGKWLIKLRDVAPQN